MSDMSYAMGSIAEAFRQIAKAVGSLANAVRVTRVEITGWDPVNKGNDVRAVIHAHRIEINIERR